MKKLILAGIALVIALSLVTCEFGQIIDKNFGLTNVVYETDANGAVKAVTLYLTGGVPRTAASRSLNTDIAKRGHDYYEVVFKDTTNTPSTGDFEIRRSAWTLGENATIKDLTRGEDYGFVDATEEYAAILMIGRKSDKTLLAVGEITAVDGEDGVTIIGPTATSVTFTVTALQAGLDATNASFELLDDDDVVVSEVFFNFPTQPVTQVPSYEIAYNGGTNGTGIYSATYEIKGGAADHKDGILIASDRSDFYDGEFVTTAKMPIGGGLYVYLDPLDLETKVALENNDTSDNVFDPILEFSIDASDVKRNGAFGLTFSIPVYGIDDTDAVIWKIKPGYEGYTYNLDDGTGGLGGAVLFIVEGPEGASNVIQILTK